MNTEALAKRVLASLDKELAICAAATAGPWLFRGKSDAFHGPPPEGSGYTYGSFIMQLNYWDDSVTECYRDEDVDFILHARTGYEASLRALREQVEWLTRRSSDGWNGEFMDRLRAIARHVGVLEEEG